MPNIGALLKQEIARLSRRETRTQLETLKRASAQYRQGITALRKQVITLERELARLSRHQATGAARAAAPESAGPKVRFSPKWIRPAREKLGLSAADYGRLLGVTGQTVYNWEHGASEPRGSQLQRIAEIRGIGKREARNRLDALDADKPKRTPKPAAAKPGRKRTAKAAEGGKAKAASPRKAAAAAKPRRPAAAAKPAADKPQGPRVTKKPATATPKRAGTAKAAAPKPPKAAAPKEASPTPAEA